MLKINKDSKIYLLCPSQIATGGTESIHLLCHHLIERGYNSKIVYLKESFPDGNGHPGHGIIDRSAFWQDYIDGNLTKTDLDAKPYPIFPCKNEEFSKYKTELSMTIEDDSNNILIVPEIFLNALERYDNIQKCIWWLAARLNDDGTYEQEKWFNFDENPEVIHFYNSNFSEYMLLSNNAQYIHRLQTFVNIDFIEDYDKIEKHNLIVFNPKKGAEFVEKLYDKYPNIGQYVPLKNYTRDTVKKVLRDAKVYIDFGHHPGRERLPREAVLSGCCVIVGHRGSARFFQDVPIKNKYKFDCSDLDVDGVAKTIKSCFENYDEQTKDFDSYRRVLKNNIDQFIIDTDNIFGSNK